MSENPEEFDSESLRDSLRAFDIEVNEKIREIAAKHFNPLFLRSHVLTIGLYDPSEDRERCDVLPPDGQSAFTTAGLLANATALMLQ